MIPLTATDYAALEKSYLTREIIEAARVQRVDSVEGAEVVGRKASNGHDYSGIVFPYYLPGATRPREHRLRRDRPDLVQKPDGAIKEKDKYLSPPGRGNLFYFVPGTPNDWLTDASVPAVITEGEKKSLALKRFFAERDESALILGLPGVWNWRGTIGKTTNAAGQRQDVKGVIPDVGMVNWYGRLVWIVYDANARTDESVSAARRALASELKRRGAIVRIVELPDIPGANGIDDILNLRGPGFVANLFQEFQEFQEEGDIWQTPVPFNQYELPAFPVDALSEWQQAFAEGLAVETQTPADMAAMLTLTNAAAAIGGNVVVEVRDGWEEPTNIYNVNVIDVGNRKTAVHDKCKAPLENVEHILIRETQPLIDEAKAQQDVIEARIDHLKKSAGKATEAERNDIVEEIKVLKQELREINAPVVPKLIVSGDITPEAVASTLVEQGGRLFLSSDEGELFQMLAGRYSNGAPNFEVVLKAHTGSKFRVDRRGRSEVVERATLTIALTVQPDVLSGLADKPGFRGRGLLARWLYSIPQSLVGRRDSKSQPLDSATRNTYAARIKALARFGKTETGDGELAPRVINLSPGALDCLVEFMDALEPQLAEGGELYPIADWACKLAGAVARIAGVLHCADYANRLSGLPGLTVGTMERAISIGRYLIPHAQACYAAMGADPEIEAARYVLRWIRKWIEAGSDLVFRKQDAWQGTKGRFKKVADLDKALGLLVDHEFIRQVITDRRQGPGRKPGGVYEINPLTTSYNSYNSYNSDNHSNSSNSRNCRTQPESQNPELEVEEI